MQAKAEFFFGNTMAMAKYTAEILLETAVMAVEQHGHFTVALSGGTSPIPLYRLLCGEPWRSEMPWSKTRIFFADERCVPVDDPRSNFGMVREELLRHVPVTDIFRIHGEDEPQAAAAHYQQMFKAHTPHGLDCALLGMGADGHTASLFPDGVALSAAEEVAVVEEQEVTRITLTLPALNAAKMAIFYVAGQGKTTFVHEIMAAEASGGTRLNLSDFPAMHVRPYRRVWVVDETNNPFAGV